MILVNEKSVKRWIDRFVDSVQIPEERDMFYKKAIMVANLIYGHGKNKEKIRMVQAALDSGDNRWISYINSIFAETNPTYLKKLLFNVGYNAFIRGTSQIRENREKYNCNIPWLILFDPTSACNMRCTGCWSGTYGARHNLTFDEMDKIITEGKELGIYLYMLTGGEPLVRKNDILRLAEKHNDVMLAIYTNSTMIDKELCHKVQQLGNITFLLSIEGDKESNDARRGKGHHDAVMNAMNLLKRHGIIFATSICYTRQNIEAVTSDEFLKMISEHGARFGFYFHYMPVGKNAVPELLPTVEQRKQIINRIHELRSLKSDIPFFPMDFQNDGEYVGGCIAGGRNYFHINSSGDAEPCVFIHFSDSNIREKSILQILQSPLFMAYYEGQPFNRNMLRPCPMLENPEILPRIINATGAHGTNQEAEESAEELCAKCKDYAAEWQIVADNLWQNNAHSETTYKNYNKEKIAHPELAAFCHADGTDEILLKEFSLHSENAKGAL